MTYALTVLTIALAIAWIPLALRFLQGWRNRKNPVSLAICAALCLFTYTDVLVSIVLINGTTLAFFVIATRIFHLIVVINFYVAFKWSARRFPDQRHRSNEYSVPPTNTQNTSTKP